MPIAFPATLWSSSSGGSTAPVPLVYWEADYGIVTTTDGTNPDASPVSGNRVLSWTSKDGTATVASHATNSQRPIYKVPTYGNPYVTFDGTASHRLETTAWNSTFNGAAQYTIGMSFRKPAAYSGYRNERLMAFNTSDVHGMIKAGPGGSGYAMFGGGSSRVYMAYSGELTSQGSLFGSFSTTGTSTTAGSSVTKMYFNGSLVVSDTTTTATTNISDRITLGGTTDPTNSKTKDIYGFYLYNTQLSDSDLLSVHNAIMSRMNVTDIYATNNSLLLHFDGANGSTTFTDSSPNALTVTANNATISTSNTMSGFGQVGSFTGSSSYLTVPSSSPFIFGTGDFTIEFWLYLNSSSGVQVIYDSRPISGGGLFPTIYYTANSVRYYQSQADRITSSAISLNTWYHVAVVRSSSVTRMYLNGTQTGSSYADTNNYSCGTGRPWIGADSFNGGSAPANFFNGKLDDLRITNGVARYTANFTVPTAPFPNS